MILTKVIAGVTYYYSDNLFLGDEDRSTCPFCEFFTNGDPESMIYCYPACHMVGQIENNPALICKGDPYKCPLMEGKFYKRAWKLLEDVAEGHRENWHEWQREVIDFIDEPFELEVD